MKVRIDYRQVLRAKAAHAAQALPEHKPLDSLGYRNMKAMSDWLIRRAKHGHAFPWEAGRVKHVP